MDNESKVKLQKLIEEVLKSCVSRQAKQIIYQHVAKEN
jgi:hypothetical protein